MNMSMYIIDYEDPMSTYDNHSINIHSPNIILTYDMDNMVRLSLC